jgi:hypothetical protein
MMPIVTNPLLTSWQAKFQKLMEGKMSLIELTKQRVQERLNTQKLEIQLADVKEEMHYDNHWYFRSLRGLC